MTLTQPKPYKPIAGEAELYVREIWADHCQRRQSEFPLMSSAEFSLAYGWYEERIPLCVVLRAFKDTEKAGSSLFYYRSPVEQAMRMWRKAVQA